MLTGSCYFKYQKIFVVHETLCADERPDYIEYRAF